jgi:hypothetical protein
MADDKVVSLDAVRALRDFESDEKLAYIEILWGKGTFAVHAAIRDLEAMRMGQESADKALRDPETVFEAQVLVDRLRWVSNFLARQWGLEERVRPEDWQGDERKLQEDEG